MRRLLVLLVILASPAAAAQPAIPAGFVGEWRATVISAEGGYQRWYRPGDVSGVAISRLGILRTLDGGGGLIHFALAPRRHADGRVDVVADRVIGGLPKPEHVVITPDQEVLRVEVEIPDVGRMTLELSPLLPLGVT